MHYENNRDKPERGMTKKHPSLTLSEFQLRICVVPISQTIMIGLRCRVLLIYDEKTTNPYVDGDYAVMFSVQFQRYQSPCDNIRYLFSVKKACT